jgi:hypothetical protein
MANSQNPEALNQAERFLLERIKGRMEKDGDPWFSKEDSTEACAKFGINIKTIMEVYKRIAREIGRKPIRGNERIYWLIEWLKLTDGEITAEVREEFAKRFPSSKLVGPIIRAARKRIGLADKCGGRRRTDNGVPLPGGLAEAANVFQHYQKLLDLELELELKLGEVKAELEKYKPVARALENVKVALTNMKSETERLGK